MTHIGSCVTARGVRPVINYQHKFKTTYLYGSYSPLDGSSFVWGINGVNKEIFHNYLNALSEFKPREYKIVIIDNAGFHSTKDMEIPKNIFLLNIPPYCPELNPCEQIWAYIKKRYKNKVFPNMEELKEWLHNTVQSMDPETIKNITSNHHFRDNFYAAFND